MQFDMFCVYFLFLFILASVKSQEEYEQYKIDVELQEPPGNSVQVAQINFKSRHTCAFVNLHTLNIEINQQFITFS